MILISARASLPRYWVRSDEGQIDAGYCVHATRIDAHGSVAHCKDAEVRLDTDVEGRTDAFSPAELLLASLACMLKSIERSVTHAQL
jgi:hypothetical protein